MNSETLKYIVEVNSLEGLYFEKALFGDKGIYCDQLDAEASADILKNQNPNRVYRVCALIKIPVYIAKCHQPNEPTK